MSSDGVVIAADGLGKSYHLFARPHDRLKQFLLPPLQRALGLRSRRYYQPFDALVNVSFLVRRGETVGVVGRNGSGKSTLLQLLCGTLSPTAGSVCTRGRIAALLELGSGFNPEFTGRENVRLGATILGLAAHEIDAVFDDIVRFADIGEFLDQPLKTYSSGMVVRLAFATAIHVEPDILVIDEALAVGDVAFQQKCLDRIRLLQRRGVSILLVTHSTNALIEYCDRAIFLKHGRLVFDGPCRDVVKMYADDLVREEGGSVSEMAPATGETYSASVPDLQGDPSADAVLVVEDARLLDGAGEPCSTVMHGGTLCVRLRVRAMAQVAAPCMGVQISSVDGISLWSTTTQALGMDIGPLEPGVHEFDWLLRADFGGSRYVVALGVGQMVNGEYRRSHRLGYAGHFDVIAPVHSGSGWLAPQPRLVARTALSEVPAR